MFLKQRAAQAEYFDEPGRSPEAIAEDYRNLGRVNRFFHFAEPFQRLLPPIVGEAHCKDLTLLDLGGGDGSLGRALTTWASARGWTWQCTNLDICPHALRLNPQGRNVLGSVLSLPFPENSFDVVISAQMAHHLASESEVRLHFKEAYRVSRRALLLYDLHRSLALYLAIFALMTVLPFPRRIRADGLLSVKKGWKVAEWKSLVETAGLPGAKVWADYHARIMLQACKLSPADP